MEWIEALDRNKDEWFVIFILLLLFLGVLRQNESARLSIFFRGFINPSLLSQQVRQDRTYHRITAPLLVIVIIILSLFAQQFLYHYNYMQPTTFWGDFALILLGLVTITAIRFLVFWVLKLIFDANSIYRLHQVQWLQHNFMLAILLLPMTIMITFGPHYMTSPLLIFGASLALITFAVRTLRHFILVQSELSASWMYNVLYLCALEILPSLMVTSRLWKTAIG